MKRSVTLNNWTAKRAHTFAKRRLGKIEEMLEEIAYVYSGVDDSVDDRCTEARDGDIMRVREAIDHALETDAQL